jgi:hypothetical protein
VTARVAALALVVAAALAAGCGKKRQTATGDDLPPPISAEERARSVEACRRYADQVCACATAKPDSAELAEMCTLDRALPEALQVVLETLEHPETQHKDAVLAKNQVKKLATSCFERIAKLPTLGCGDITAASGSAPAAGSAAAPAPAAGSAAPPPSRSP